MKMPRVELDVLKDVSAEIHPEECTHDPEWTSKVHNEMFLENPTLLGYINNWVRVEKDPFVVALGVYKFIKAQLKGM